MYDEIRKDLAGKTERRKGKHVARWDLATKALLKAASNTKKPCTVGWLSQRTGLSKSYLSNVTTGKIKDPPSERLIKIANAFEISFPDFARRAMGEVPNAFFKTGFNQRAFIDYSQHGFTIQSLSPPGTGQRDFFMGIMSIKPLKELKRWQFKSSSMIAIYVEQGTLEVVFGDTTHRIHSNESAYFDGSIPHRFKNVDTFEAKVFLVTRPPLH